MGYFNKNEFECSCCGRSSIKQELIDMLNKARQNYGKPIRVTSGFRCFLHNRAVGGSDTSSHTEGWAADLAVHNSRQRMELLSALLQAGFGRIGIAKTFIHVDVDPHKPFDVIWVY